MPTIPIRRYPATISLLTHRDPLADLLVHLEYLRAEGFIIDLLASAHGVPKKDAQGRASQIISHARIAHAFFEQALVSRDEAAFLPGYYAILNLLKLYILFSPHHEELQGNRYHGASYDVYGKDSQTLLTETVTLRERGTISLAYRVITGKAIPDYTKVRMDDLYPYISDVALEWELATGRPSLLAVLGADIETNAAGERRASFTVAKEGSSTLSLNTLLVLRGVERAAAAGKYVSPFVPNDGSKDEVFVASFLRKYLVFDDRDGIPFTPISGRRLHFPEELPIALAFFHLSSIVRYKPSFVSRLKDSRHWPIVAALRWHGLLRMLCLCMSHVQQRSVLLNPP